MTELIRDKEKWTFEVSQFEKSDFYHTFDYHQVSKNPEDKPVLFLYKVEGLSFAFPLLVRSIPGSTYKDATSVYGYPGPLIRSARPDFNREDLYNAMNAFFEKERIVSVFSRLNPFIPYQDYALENLGEIVTPGHVVNIDVSKDPVTQVSEYHKRLRTYINKCRRTYIVREKSDQESLTLFMDLYHDNMRRVGAKPKYFFDADYFEKLLESQSFESNLMMAETIDTGETVAGALFIKKKQIVQYHLSGVLEDYLHLNPVKLLIDEMRIRATEEGYQYFNLGGGVANKEDSLFQFKRSFSRDVKPFNVWRYIVDRKVYDQLVRNKEAVNCRLSTKPCNDFFPCYRCEMPVLKVCK